MEKFRIQIFIILERRIYAFSGTLKIYETTLLTPGTTAKTSIFTKIGSEGVLGKVISKNIKDRKFLHFFFIKFIEKII